MEMKFGFAGYKNRQAEIKNPIFSKKDGVIPDNFGGPGYYFRDSIRVSNS